MKGLEKDTYIPQSYSLNSVSPYMNKFQKETNYFYKVLVLPETNKPEIDEDLLD